MWSWTMTTLMEYDYGIRDVIWDAKSAAHAKISLYNVLIGDVAYHLDSDVINIKVNIKRIGFV